MQLDIESIRTFLAVLDHGGMTRAAEHLELSQSAVSWKIKRLEAKVGRPLLVRDGHTIRPSFEGRNLIDDARLMVELHDRAVSRLRHVVRDTFRHGRRSHNTGRYRFIRRRRHRDAGAGSVQRARQLQYRL